MTRKPTEMEMRVAKTLWDEYKFNSFSRTLLYNTADISFDEVIARFLAGEFVEPQEIKQARAAIRAMREPTDEMMTRGTSTILIEHMTRPTKAAGNFVQFPASTSHDVWTAMITVASPDEE